MAKTKELTVRDERYALADKFVKAFRKCEKLAKKKDEIIQELNEVTGELNEAGIVCNGISLDLKQRVHSPTVPTTDVKCIVVSDAEVLIVPKDSPCLLFEVV